MSYVRTIPRDLFNEANLLKCLGALWIKTECFPSVTWSQGPHCSGAEGFDIQQDESSGALWCANVVPVIHGIPYMPERPLNSRDTWPLYLDGDHDLAIFTDEGDLSSEFLEFIKGELDQ